VDAGDGDLRVRELRARLLGKPDDLQARLALASHYSSAGFPDVAIEHYRLAASRWPDNADLAVLLARSLHKAGATGEARLHLESFLIRNPEAGADVWSWAGIVQDAMTDYSAGERSHRAALNRNNQSPALHNNLGYNLLLQGRFAEAAPEFRQALLLDPASALARSNLAIALAERPGEAVKTWNSRTDTATAHNNLGAVLMERGDYDGARREFEAALVYNKQHPAALSNLQLVADLDRGMFGLPAAGAPSAWRRFVRSLGSVLLGEEPGKIKSPASSAGKFPPAPQGAALN
jgi:Flp pilus assembly protein TadD